MPQYRPRRVGPASAPTPPSTPVTRDGWHYSVSEQAAGTLSTAVNRSDSAGVAAIRDLATEVPITQARAEIGREGLLRAAADAGAARSPSTVARWARTGRIPDARTRELVQRRAFIARLGGIDAAAAQLGTSASAVSRWQTGRSNTMRRVSLDAAQAADARQRAGLGQIVGARLHVRAHVQYRAYGSTSDEYRGAREIDIDIDEADAAALADALINSDYAAAAAVTEDAWSQWYGHAYSDESGVHMLDVAELDIDWY